MATEIEKALKNKSKKNLPTVFDKIISKEIKSDILYEDGDCLAFSDINPVAPTHFLVIPKRKIAMLDDVEEEDNKILGKLLQISAKLGKNKMPNGYRIVINNGSDGCQSVWHLHVHVIGGRQMSWPPG